MLTLVSMSCDSGMLTLLAFSRRIRGVGLPKLSPDLRLQPHGRLQVWLGRQQQQQQPHPQPQLRRVELKSSDYYDQKFTPLKTAVLKEA